MKVINPEFRINPEVSHPCIYRIKSLPAIYVFSVQFWTIHSPKSRMNLQKKKKYALLLLF